MHLPTDLVKELENPALSVSDRARQRCRIAQHYEQIGEYEAASEVLWEFWRGVGVRPNLAGLNETEQAEVILRVGSLTGWIGSARQIEGAQEAAKDLITRSVTLFRAQGRRSKAAEARSDLALCYWRTGEYDEARVMLQEAYAEIDQWDFEQRAITLMRRALVERESKRLNDALRLHHEAKPLFEQINNHLLTAHYHHAYANVLNRLSAAEERTDYIDLALIEYTAASFHFGEAGHERYQACVENNIGHLLGKLDRFADAHEHLDRAQVLLTKLQDKVHLSQVDETRATILLAEGRDVEAEETARSAILRLEGGDELGWLAEALTTHGIALARLAHPQSAHISLARAIDAAEKAGNFERAGIAALTLIEQLGEHLAPDEIRALIDSAKTLVDKTTDIETVRRAARSAFRVLFDLHLVSTSPDWKDFSLRETVRKFEGDIIKQALKEGGGSVTTAARLLGLKHHQSLSSRIESKHADLLNVRTPKRKRRKHLMQHPPKKRKRATPESSD